MRLAPIVLFIYNRPHYLLQTLESLAKNSLAKDSTLIIYADGVKENATEEDITKINETRTVAKSKQWCKEINIIEKEKNLGLANSIIEGVTEIVNKHGKVIVLEDDLELSPYFLQFMNDGLAVYENNEKVWSVGACNFFAHGNKIPETFFIPIPDCWGWATWKDRWQYFEPDSNKLIKLLKEKNLVDDFNLGGAYDFMGMLESQAQGKISSWAIRWQAVAYLKNAYSLYPKCAVTNHIGIDESATHSQGADYSHLITFPLESIKVERKELEIDFWVMRFMKETYISFGKKVNIKVVKNDSKVYIKKQNMKVILKKFIPPILIDLYRFVRPLPITEPIIVEKPIPVVSWNGNYTSWEEAKNACTGYEAGTILEKVKNSILKVKRGEAVYERDSFIFDKIQYSWALVAILFRVAVEHNNELNILDFGGSLGSSYFQNRGFLNGLKKIEWSVVEQTHFVECGKKEIADENLKFYHTIEECIQDRKPNVLLLSGVIQCLDKPYEWIEKFLSYGFDYIIIDRTAFIEDEQDRLTIQEVHEPIYEASYPTWFFNEVNFLKIFEKKYELVTEFDSGFTPSIRLEDNIKGYWSGFILKKWQS
jgi:putative methyltransferase (TIGR04325 family)